MKETPEGRPIGVCISQTAYTKLKRLQRTMADGLPVTRLTQGEVITLLIERAEESKLKT